MVQWIIVMKIKPSICLGDWRKPWKNSSQVGWNRDLNSGPSKFESSVLPTSVTNIEHQSFFKMAAFGLHTVSKSLWPPIYWITLCLLWEIRHFLHQGALQDLDIGVPLLTEDAFKHCPLLGVHWAEVRAAEGPINPESPGVIESGKSPGARPR